MPAPVLVDTHTHIYLDRFDEDRDAVIERARAAGVAQLVLPAIDVPSIERALALADRYSGVYVMSALHPSAVQEATDADFERVAAFCDHEKVVAVGESGLDYYWDRSYDEKQQDFFRRHVRLAAEVDLPLVIHNREATEDVLRILADERRRLEDPSRLRGILHCFVDGPAEAERAGKLGFLVGLGGILTFKNSGLDERVAGIPLEQIVVETDAPFLAPHPERGTRNEPAYVRLVAEKLAAVKGLPYEEVARVTTANARRLYALPDEEA